MFVAAPARRSFDKGTEDALFKFQSFYQLKTTGVLDEETLELMKTPRCGVPDFVEEVPETPDYVLSGTKWPTPILSYTFENFTGDLTQDIVERATRDALELWDGGAGDTPLQFSEVAQGGDLSILFGAGDHGDPYPFDGPGGVLAHAFYPTDGRVHFDEDETWSDDDPPSGIDLVTVAAHEFGHALGLKHSNVTGALMFAYYGGPNRSLHSDDIAGIRALYGRRPPPRAKLDHFKVYEVWEQGVPPLSVTLKDQFASEEDVRPRGLTHFAAPVIKNDQEVIDPNAHLTWYRVDSRAPIRRVEVSNQFNPRRKRQRLYVQNPEYLMVPTQKEGYRSSFPKDLDHYRCYRVIRSRPVEAKVRLRDQFGEEETIIGRARYLCVPVSKNGTEIKNSKDHLVAYRIRERVGYRQRVRIANQFTAYHPIAVTLTRSVWLCVPSRKLRTESLEKEE